MAGTPDQIARGEYLVSLSCVGCHGSVGADGNPTEQPPLTGGWNIAAAEGFGFMGAMVTENLTPGGKLADYSDGELFRVMRHSISKEGHKLGFMDFLPYKELSDEDTQALIAYMRSLPPTKATAADRRQLQLHRRSLDGIWDVPAIGAGRGGGEGAAEGNDGRVRQVCGDLRRVPRLPRA